MELRDGQEGLTLVGADGLEMTPALTGMLPRLRRDRLSRELLVRAAKVRGVEAPTAFDATAGMGEDSLLLAAAGFIVTLYESDHVIAELLKDSLGRAASDPRLADPVARMQAHEGDSIAALRELASSEAAPPDVVYLDPMFPERRKSAAVGKKFQLLHELERPCANPEELLDAALAVHPRKVVVKRPVKGPYLADAKPSYSLAGKAVRFDVIVPPRP